MFLKSCYLEKIFKIDQITEVFFHGEFNICKIWFCFQREKPQNSRVAFQVTLEKLKLWFRIKSLKILGKFLNSQVLIDALRYLFFCRLKLLKKHSSTKPDSYHPFTCSNFFRAQ